MTTKDLRTLVVAIHDVTMAKCGNGRYPRARFVRRQRVAVACRSQRNSLWWLDGSTITTSNMTKYSDFLQKISSAATPPNGRAVPSMDEIVERELSGRYIDESNIKSTIPNLVQRLFPSLLKVTPEGLNRQYSELLEQRKSARESKLNQATRINSRYDLRPRKRQPPPQVPSQSKQTELDEKVQSQPLYDMENKEWNVKGFQPAEEILALQHMIQEHDHLRPPTAHTSNEMIPGLVVDGPMSPGSDQDGGSSTIHQVPSQQDVADPVMTDPKNSDEDHSSSFVDVARRGAAYDGDSFRDKNYQEAGKRKQKQVEAAPVASEVRWAAFLNAIADATSDLPLGQLVESSAGRVWFGCFSSKPMPSEPGQVQWNRKPDLVLLADRQSSNDAVTWRNPKALGELTISDLQHNTTLTKSLMTKAYILLSSQPWRRYALAISIANDELRVYLFDRSGVVISPPINIHKRVREIRDSLLIRGS